MKEGKLILVACPKLVRDTLERILVNSFGGFTASKAEGVFQGVSELYREEVTVYTLALKDNGSTRIVLRGIAKMVQLGLGEESVYIKHANGEVEFIGEDFSDV